MLLQMFMLQHFVNNVITKLMFYLKGSKSFLLKNTQISKTDKFSLD